MATLVVRPVRSRRADDIFFTTMSVVMLVIIFIGFAPSYFLAGVIFAPLPSLLVHLHGAVFSSWIILFVVQSCLVSAGNIRLHRKLGVLGAVIAGLMVILGILATFGNLRRGAMLPPFFTPAAFLIDNGLGILFFGALVAMGIQLRNNRPAHKRLMFIANANLMGPAIGRMTFPVIAHHPFLIGVIPLGLIAILLIFDLFTWKRPLWATVIAGFATWAMGPVSDAIAGTPLAQQLTYWAQHHP